ncbi:RHS repeat-associated core domain-containing protein, partial [Nocardia arizonensis]
MPVKTGDAGGLNLTSRTKFERPGEGFLRQVAATLPAGDLGNADTHGKSEYYGDNETRANPCVSNSPAVPQGGRVKAVRTAKTSDGTASVLETVYTAAGRIAATRSNNEPWSCVSYDARGRELTKTYPALDDQPARTVTHDYAVGGDPRKHKVTDNSGSTTAVLNLHLQVVSYTDANGVTTTFEYDLAGRKTSETTTIDGVGSTLKYFWDDASRLTRLELDGQTVATPGYQAGVLTSATYGNGTSLAIGHNDAGSLVGLTWKVPGSEVTNAATRSRDQRIIDDRITDTADPSTIYDSHYTYDGVGRLVAASVPFHQLTYGYAAADGCGPNAAAGLNTNRTSFADSFNGGPAAVTNYCYDGADRLLSTNGATALSFVYDPYGNATKVGADTLGYDSTLRHMRTTTAAGRSVTYTRDVHDRISARTVKDGTNPDQVTRYGFTSDSGGPEFILDGAGKLRQRVVNLPGGALLTKNYPQNTAAWSYPNIHGDILITADGAGARTGAIHLYDPFGQNIDPTTGAFGDIPIPATAEGGMDFGWLGQHTVPVEHAAGQQAVEMGARTYLPILGRFLQVDPVPGGSANSYDYVNGDPVNTLDLNGKCPACAASAAVVPVVAATAAQYGPKVHLKDRSVEAPSVNLAGIDDSPAPANSPTPKSQESTVRLLSETTNIPRATEIGDRINLGGGSYVESRWYGWHLHLGPDAVQYVYASAMAGAGAASLLGIWHNVPGKLVAGL